MGNDDQSGLNDIFGQNRISSLAASSDSPCNPVSLMVRPFPLPLN
jgi:hypothetical protein